MAIDNYSGGLYLKDTDIVDVIKQTVSPHIPTKTSDLTNNSGYITSASSVANATSADTAVNLTGTSGVSAGSYGPTAAVTIGNSSTGSINLPYFTVNAQGIITSSGHSTLTVTTGCNNCSVSCSKCSKCSNCSNCNDCDSTP